MSRLRGEGIFMIDRRLLATHAVAHWANATPIAVASQHVDGRSLTYADLHDSALRWAAAFMRVGITRGDHVATMLPIGFDAQLAMLGLGWLRAIDVPVNVAYRGKLLHYVLHHADVTTLVVAGEYLERVIEIADDLPDLQTVIVLGAEVSALPAAARALGRPVGLRRVVGGGDFLHGVGPAESLPGPEYRDIAALLFTSGTTGPSKAVIVPWALVRGRPDDPRDGRLRAALRRAGLHVLWPDRSRVSARHNLGSRSVGDMWPSPARLPLARSAHRRRQRRASGDGCCRRVGRALR